MHSTTHPTPNTYHAYHATSLESRPSGPTQLAITPMELTAKLPLPPSPPTRPRSGHRAPLSRPRIAAAQRQTDSPSPWQEATEGHPEGHRLCRLGPLRSTASRPAWLLSRPAVPSPDPANTQCAPSLCPFPFEVAIALR